MSGSAFPVSVGFRGQGARAAEADAVAPRVWVLCVPEGGAKPGRVAAVPAAAADHLALARLGALGVLLRLFGVRAVPICDPLPDVSDHVVGAEARASRFETPDGSGGGIAVVLVVERREHGLVAFAPGDALGPTRVQVSRGRLVVTPRVDASVGAARRVLPLRLRGQPFALCAAVERRHLPGDAVDRVIEPI